MKNDSNLPANADELSSVQESLNVVAKQKSKRQKKKVTKYALMSGASAAVRHFRKNNPYLTESTVGKTLS